MFVSYVREDKAEVDRLQRILVSAGFRVWRDTEDLWPGDDWELKIRQAISENALVFIACFSHRSTARTTSYQNKELLLAVDQLQLRRPDQPWLIPVRFGNCELPRFDLGGGRTLAALQWVDLFGDQWDTGTPRLIRTVDRILTDLGRQRDSGASNDRSVAADDRIQRPVLGQPGPLDSWRPGSLTTSSGRSADLGLRCAVLLPECDHAPVRTNDIASTITGTPREAALVRLLSQSELSEWLLHRRQHFGLVDLPDWAPYGHNAGDNSRLIIEPTDEADELQLVAAACQINTGWIRSFDGFGELDPGLEVVADLMLRRRENDPHAQDALSMPDLFEALVALMATAQQVALDAWLPVLGSEAPSSGILMCWLETTGPPLNHTVDLAALRSIPGSGGGAYGQIRRDLPLDVNARRGAVRDLLATVLEHSGFRGYEGRLEALIDPTRIR